MSVSIGGGCRLFLWRFPHATPNTNGGVGGNANERNFVRLPFGDGDLVALALALFGFDRANEVADRDMADHTVNDVRPDFLSSS